MSSTAQFKPQMLTLLRDFYNGYAFTADDRGSAV